LNRHIFRFLPYNSMLNPLCAQNQFRAYLLRGNLVS
jgi:hypothetical protein